MYDATDIEFVWMYYKRVADVNKIPREGLLTNARSPGRDMYLFHSYLNISSQSTPDDISSYRR